MLYFMCIAQLLLPQNNYGHISKLFYTTDLIPHTLQVMQSGEQKTLEDVSKKSFFSPHGFQAHY